MAARDDGWTGAWLAEKICNSSKVANAKPLSRNAIKIDRKLFGPVVVATMAAERVDAAGLQRVLSECAHGVQFAVNIPTESYIVGDALRLSEAQGVPVGSVSDLNHALDLEDVSTYVNKEIAFIERGLDQHTHVEGFVRLSDRLYQIERSGSLPDLHAVFLNEYELGAERLRTARERYGRFSVVARTNPHGGATTKADEAAESMGCVIYDWREFLSALRKR